MARQTQNVLRIMEEKTGASFIVDCTDRTSDKMILIAETAVRLNIKVTFANTSKIKTDNLIRVAQAGGKNVTIEL